MDGKVKNPLKSVSGLMLLSLLLASGCASIDDRPVYSKNGLSLTFPRLSDIADGHEEQKGELDDFQIDHPIRIDTAMVQNHLRSLWYRKAGSKTKPAPVFSEKEIRVLGPLFKVALNKVTPSQYISFEYQSPEGAVEGEVFGTVGKVHWRFNRIRDVYFSDDLLSDHATWKLVRRQRSQQIRVEKTALMGMTRENWIINDIRMPGPGRKNRSKPN